MNQGETRNGHIFILPHLDIFLCYQPTLCIIDSLSDADEKMRILIYMLCFQN